MSTSPLHMQKDLHNTMKWFQIHRMGISWVNEHNVENSIYIYIYISFKCYMWYILKIGRVHKNLIVNKSFGSFNCDPTHVSAWTWVMNLWKWTVNIFVSTRKIFSKYLYMYTKYSCHMDIIFNPCGQNIFLILFRGKGKKI